MLEILIALEIAFFADTARFFDFPKTPSLPCEHLLNFNRDRESFKIDFIGIQSAGKCNGDKDGRQQPGDGDGAQLPSLLVQRPEGDLRKHSQRNGISENPCAEFRHFLYQRCALMTTQRLFGSQQCG